MVHLPSMYRALLLTDVLLMHQENRHMPAATQYCVCAGIWPRLHALQP